MAISLFRKDNCQPGDSHVITGNVSNLKDVPVGHSTSSMSMTAAADGILLFTKTNYNGDVMFRSGIQQVNKMSSPAKGGKTGFGNTIASARVTPFQVRLFINIVARDDGSFSGFRSADGAQGTEAFDLFPQFIRDIVSVADAIWRKFLIGFTVPEITLRRSSKLHNMKNELYPLLWKNWQKPGHANVYLVGELSNASGICPPVGWGRGAVVDCGLTPNVERAGDTLAHELGHYFGLSEHQADTDNLMTSAETSRGVLTTTQVEEAHKALATNILRQKLRIE